ncbi:MAG: sulfatase-like hydrolase/transferase, partial [Actinomycetes bacterium]
FLNAYPQPQHPTRALPGWDDWHAGAGAGPYDGYRYTMVENGRRVHYGNHRGKHNVDVLRRKASSFVRSNRDRARSFFLYLAPYAPHAPATPPRRYAHAFRGVQSPETANRDPANTTGETPWERLLPRMSPREKRGMDARHRERLRSMLGVQDMVQRLVRTLRRTGQLDNTYLVFASDNGYHLGQHQLPPGKRSPFEEDIRVPLVVRGPGVPAGRRVDALTSTTDVAPTLARLGGADTPSFVDGRSLVPMLHGRTPPRGWRDATLVERANEYELGPFDPDQLDDPGQPLVPMPSYQAIRTNRYTYVEYVDGERALYDTEHDPHQLHNLAHVADPSLIQHLSARLRDLANCAGASCRRADHDSH